MEKAPNLIEDLFCGKLDPARYGPAENSAYRQCSDDVSTLIDVVKDTLGKETGRKLEDTIIKLEGVVAQDHFVLGFQWGAQMMLAILDDAPASFSCLPASGNKK